MSVTLDTFQAEMARSVRTSTSALKDLLSVPMENALIEMELGLVLAMKAFSQTLFSEIKNVSISMSAILAETNVQMEFAQM